MTRKIILVPISLVLTISVLFLYSTHRVYAADTVVFLTTGTSWTVPSDWNSSSNSIEVIGSGTGGGSGGALASGVGNTKYSGGNGGTSGGESGSGGGGAAGRNGGGNDGGGTSGFSNGGAGGSGDA